MATTVDELQQEKPPAPDESDILLCPHCVKTITQFDHFCPHCNGPITGYASIDPVGETRSIGYVFSQAIERAPHPFVFFGAWLIIAPQLLAIAGYFVIGIQALLRPPDPLGLNTSSQHDGVPIFIILVFNLILAAIYTAILYQLTRKYFAKITPPSDPLQQ